MPLGFCQAREAREELNVVEIIADHFVKLTLDATSYGADFARVSETLVTAEPPDQVNQDMWSFGAACQEVADSTGGGSRTQGGISKECWST